MPKSKSTRIDRTHRTPRDPGPDREDRHHKVSAGTSDGVIDAELDELDTDKYEPPVRKAH
jgi:hypothetical protein